MTVTAVVSHYEQHDDLARCLAALARQDSPVHQVLVTDDGSATPPEVPPGIELLTQPDHGFRVALARNRAIRAATGDVLVLLDADTAPEPSYVGRVADVVRAEPDVLVVGRRRHTDYDAGPLDPADPLRGAEAHELEEPAWLAEGWAATDDLRDADEGSFRFVISAVMAGSRSWFERVRGFDERFERYGGEDWDLAHRWWVAGGRLRHDPAAVAWHHGDHAGGASRRADRLDPRRSAEQLGVAHRVAARPVAFHGLRSAPARVRVTHDPGLDEREVVISLDGVLRDLPQADVVSDHLVWGSLGDDRVRLPGPDDDRALLGLHLHAGVAAEPGSWARLLDTPLTTTALEVGRLVTVTDLRRQRRTTLGLEAATSTTVAPDGLHPASDVALDAWLGGWWR